MARLLWNNGGDFAANLVTVSRDLSSATLPAQENSGWILPMVESAIEVYQWPFELKAAILSRLLVYA